MEQDSKTALGELLLARREELRQEEVRLTDALKALKPERALIDQHLALLGIETGSAVRTVKKRLDRSDFHEIVRVLREAEQPLTSTEIWERGAYQFDGDKKTLSYRLGKLKEEGRVASESHGPGKDRTWWIVDNEAPTLEAINAARLAEEPTYAVA